MMISLRKSAFHEGAIDAELVALFGLAVRGRHRIQVMPDAWESFQLWIAKQSDRVGEECEFALTQSAQAEATEPAVLSIDVASESDLHGSSPSVSASAALDYLNRPFCVLVENRRNDRAFLLSVARVEFRQRIEVWEEQGWLEFEHGGGIDEMRQRVNELNGNRLGAMRYWVIFDSDALAPGSPSSSAQALAEACGDAVAHHQLSRRAIENYLPKTALRSWAYDYSNRATRRRRGELLQAFLQLTDEQSAHFNMKTGFSGDEGRADYVAAEEFWRAVSGDVRRVLANGFGSTIARIYRGEPLHLRPEWMESEGVFDELAPAIGRLVESLR